MLEVYEGWYTTHLGILPTPEASLHQSRKERSFTIRHLEESDASLLTNFMNRLSQSTLWMRFFVPYPRLSEEKISQEIARLNHICTSNGTVLVASNYVEGKEQIIAIGEVIPEKELVSTAELALTIRDDFQGEGIGSAMAQQLLQEAGKKGITTLRAEAMAQNRIILLMWTKLGLPYSFNTYANITNMLAWL